VFQAARLLPFHYHLIFKLFSLLLQCFSATTVSNGLMQQLLGVYAGKFFFLSIA